MVKVTVWFVDSREGPQGYESGWTSKEAAELAYEDDLDCLGVQAEGEPPPPMVADFYRAHCPLCRQRARREERSE